MGAMSHRGLAGWSICRWKAGLVEWLQRGFRRYALFVYDRPWPFILVPLLCCFSVVYFILARDPVTEAEALYARHDTQSAQNRATYLATFGSLPPRQSYLVAIGDPARRPNMLQRDALRRFRALDEELRSMKVDDGRGLKFVWADICQEDGDGRCGMENVLQMYHDDSMFGSPYVLRYPRHVSRRDGMFRVWQDDMLMENITTATNTQGEKYVQAATALLFRYSCSGEPSKLQACLQWEERFIEKAHQLHIPDVTIVVNAARSIDDELAASTSLDMGHLIKLGLAGLMIFAYAAMVSFSTDLSKCKSIPALCGCAAAGLGYLAGAGLCHLCGLMHVPPAEATPFLVMGIGVDDMFVMMNSYSLAFKATSARERCAIALEDCGVSITITTLTNLVAFAIGVASPYQGIQNFALVTAAGLAMGYVMALTFFLGFLCLDARREEAKQRHLLAGYADILPFKITGIPRITPIRSHRHKVNSHSHSHAPPDAPTTSSKDSVPPSTFPPAPLPSTYQLVARQLEAHERRTKTNHPSPSHSHPSSSKSQQWMIGPSSSVTSIDDVITPDGECEEPRGTVGKNWRRFFMEFYGRALRSGVCKGLVLLVFACYVAVAVWGCLQMRAGMRLVYLTPTDSYLRTFFQESEKYFTTYGEEVEVFFPQNVQWWKPQVQDEFISMHSRLQSAPYSSGVLWDGLYEYLRCSRCFDSHLQCGIHARDADINAYNASSDRHEQRRSLCPAGREERRPGEGLEDTEAMAAFSAGLASFLDTPMYRQFAPGFKFTPDGGLASYRFQLWGKWYDSSVGVSSFMEGVRRDTAESPLRPLAYTRGFVFLESELRIFQETLTSLAWCFVAVVAVSILLIAEWKAPLLVISMIVMIDLGLFAFMHLWGLTLNMLTMITLIISIGFSVDYTTHIVHTFTHCVGKTRDHRMVETLVLMGNPVFHGAVSTQLCLMLILTVESFIFVVFFRMMTLVLVLGFAHGIILLPVLLSLVGPFDPQQQQGGAPNTTATSTPTKCTPPSHIDISITTDTEGEYRSHDVDAEHATELDERGSSTDDSQCSSSSELGEAGRPPLPPSAASAAAGRQYDDYVVSSSVRPICYDIEMELRIDRTVEVMDIRRGDVPGSS